MGRKPKKKPEIKPADIKDCRCRKYDEKWARAQNVMNQRTKLHSFFSKVAHMQSLYEKPKANAFSEGSTQAIKRKIRAQTIQRVPDGEIITQYDKASIEQAEIEFIFKHKIISSEYDGKDMLKNITKTFDMSYDYGYGCVVTEFKKDLDGDIRVGYKLIGWHDVYPAPDAPFIEEAPWYFIREYISRSELEQYLDEDHNVTDSTYNEDTLRYIVENGIKSGIEPDSVKLADAKNSVMPVESIEVRTYYERGCDKFVTYVPDLQAVLREVDNYDPRKDLPIHFLILEPDPEFPLGCSSIMWTIAQQQFADAFQTISFNTLLLASEPPILAYGNLTNAKIRMMPNSIWPMGTNPNNKVEKFPVETTTLTQYGSILQNTSANMMKNLNVTDSTIASDAKVMNYSGTPQGVEAQQNDKTITMNQYQKRIETFFSEWANHALRSYINAMGGEQEMTVDEKTRRKIFDIEASKADHETMTAPPSIIDGNKITVQFDDLSSDMLEFVVRTGSLIQSKQKEELDNIQRVLVPISQMMGAVSDERKPIFEDNMLQLLSRLCELSNIDVSAQVSKRFDDQLAMKAIQATMEQVAQQQMMINQLSANQGQMAQMMAGEEPRQAVPAGAAEAMESQAQTEVSAEFPEPGPGLS